jgi:short-subunit dehydrogenase
MSKVLIAGATSAIAQAAARLWAEEGSEFFLVARNAERLKAVGADLKARGAAKVECAAADLNDFARHEGLLKEAVAQLGGLDLVFVAHGSLGDQKACEREFALAEREFRTNFLSAASILTSAANYFEACGRGAIAVLASPAGDRGRQSNYIYGSAKGALSVFLEGLRNRLAPAGVHVLTVKPGFVDTPMTRGLPKNFLFARPEEIARGIHAALKKKKDVVYLPWFWRPIMTLIRMIPEPLFKRMRL